METLRRLGIPVVRRITGGGTVYHDRGNVNYTYITQSDGLDYDQCLGPVIAALNRMGIPAEKSKTCDLAIGGRKISGSAQRIAGGRVLHHGTLLFQSDLAMLDRITTQQKNDCFQTKGTLSAICTVTNISEHLPAPMTMQEFQARLLDEMLPSGAPRLTLSAAQEAEVCRLRDEKIPPLGMDVGRDAHLRLRKARPFRRRADHRILPRPEGHCLRRANSLFHPRRLRRAGASERRTP